MPTIISAAEVAAILGVSASDPVLVALVAGANQYALTECRPRTFEKKDRVEYCRGFGLDYLFLRESPIATIAEVRVDADGVFGQLTGTFATNGTTAIVGNGSLASTELHSGDTIYITGEPAGLTVNVITDNTHFTVTTAATTTATGQTAFGPSSTIISPSLFYWNANEDDCRLWYRGAPFPEGPRVARVTYNAGYPVTNGVAGPDDLRAELISDVCAQFKLGVDMSGFKAMRQGDVSYTRFDEGVSERLKKAIRRNRWKGI